MAAATTFPTDPRQEPHTTIARAVLWLARLASLATAGVIVAFLRGEDLTTMEAGEAVLFACFPVGVLLGLAVAWWRARLGGALALLALAAFYAIHWLDRGWLPVGPWFAVLASPAVLFLLGGWLRRASGPPPAPSVAPQRSQRRRARES
jgi:hypothetical protein